MNEIASCPMCRYPVSVSHAGEIATCPHCSQKMEVIANNPQGEKITQGVSIPTPLFAGLIGFGVGLLFGPAIIASSSAGQSWLMKQAGRV